MVKLIVQIPCFNEAETLPATVGDIPRQIAGIDVVDILVVDDGSTDRTSEVARELGVDHIVRTRSNRGLARAFRTGLDACLSAGADIIVNTDGDNQYSGADITALVRPIVEGEADIVVGDRQTATHPFFSPTKRKLQRLGSFAVRFLSGADVPDAVSGFRAMTRDAALQLNIVSPFSYTIEMLIQANRKHLAIASVPVDTNPPSRDSRLFSNPMRFIERSVSTMLRMFMMYQPLRVFFFIGLLVSFIGLVPIIRFLYFFSIGQGDGHNQSLVLGGTLLTIGFLTFIVGMVADLINFNRQLIEQTLERVRRIELELERSEESDDDRD